MFLSPLTLQNISQLRAPNEKVPLGELATYEEGLSFIEDSVFEGHEVQTTPQGSLQLQLFFAAKNTKKGYVVKVNEVNPGGDLEFHCDHCKTSMETPKTCEHQWAAFVYLWQALTSEQEGIINRKLLKLAQDLEEPLQTSVARASQARFGFSQNIKLESVSLFLEDHPLLNSESIGSLLTSDLGKFKHQEMTRDLEVPSPLLWNMPEIFRKKVTAYSGFYLNEVNEQNRLAGMLRYNFTDGTQVSAKDILRHPLQRAVTKELLPQARTQNSAFSRWPLTQQKEHLFLSQNLRELEEIIQVLLGNVATKVNQGQLKLFLQSKNHPRLGLPLHYIEFDPGVELNWRVEFMEKAQLEAEFKLMSAHKKPFVYFESFAVEPTEGMLLVHPWLHEWNQIREVLSSISADENDFYVSVEGRPTIHLEGELEAKTVLKYLRTRTMPVRLAGESRTLSPSQSQLQIHLDESGDFFVQHDARVLGQKNLLRKGWTPRTVLYLKTLSEGLPFLMNADVKDVASRARRKRDWDLKLLKHLGVLQYLFMELLSYHFEGMLSDGTVPDEDKIFLSLHSNIQALLISGSGVILAREQTLTELCSQTVLNHFEDFVAKTLKALKASESFYSEQGEVILEGVVEKEFHLLYEILKRMALSTGGDAFKKSRTSLLSKIWTGDLEKDPYLLDGKFHLPRVKKEGSQIHETLETLQGLIPFGFALYYNGQPLQELTEDEFKVDFILQTDEEHRDFNWFELNPKFFLRGQEIDPQSMSGFGSGGVIEYDGKLFLVPRKQMPSLRRLEHFWQKLQRGKTETSKKQGGEKVYHLPRHQVLELLALRASGVGIRGDEEWKKLCAFYDQMGSADRAVEIPKTVKADLKPYQVSGVQWLQDLYNLKLGALLADDMGLGKTLQTLTFLEDLRQKGDMGQVLVVVPSSLIFNWQSEVEKFTPDIPLTVFTTKDMMKVGKKLESKQDIVVLTTYGLLMENESFLNQYKWKVLIFDEAQNLKNITTKRTSSARALTARFKICLTGTPMENHYGEFYSLVDLLVPGSLGKIEDFRRQFVNTEMVTREEIEDLKLKIKPLMLRRTKKEILDQLPEKQETKVSIAFEERQMEIYRDIALSYNQKVQDSLLTQAEASVQLQMLTALLRLRQACSDPAALPNVRYDRIPPKLEALMDSIQEIVESGESALVFTQFLQTLEHTADLMHKAGIPVFVLHGGIPTKQRQKILSDFNKVPGGAVLIMTLKTGGVGLNLTKASYVFHLEPWWNPSVENQATDRAHRLGQSKAVQVFRYIMHESLEEKIELLKNRKDKKFQSLFTTTENDIDIGPGSGALTKEDFDLLIGLK